MEHWIFKVGLKIIYTLGFVVHEYWVQADSTFSLYTGSHCDVHLPGQLNVTAYLIPQNSSALNSSPVDQDYLKL